MNHIILNGRDSTTVRGLLIQTLPPITKPLIRTQVDVIDGRDGDSVTKLGYSAYDKPFSIGLYGNYDIDDVISFFDSSGIVIFSNEPDKYYRYAVYNQIDFEKLIRYKTANVTFHVQPFKYSAEETVLSFNNQLLTFTDAIESLNGITASINDGVISVVGTATAATDIFLPIPEVELSGGTLNAYSNGGGITLQLTNGSAVPFASLALQANEVVSAAGTGGTYDRLQFTVANGTRVNAIIRLQLGENADIVIRNNGNTDSRPTLTIAGSGPVGISLNGKQIFTVRMEDYITIDTEKMDASRDGVLMNRSVTGNYDNFIFKPGRNVITFTGMVTQLSITNYSRWT